MTDRDTFAAAALTGLLASMQKNAYAEEMASHAYEIADAMLRERERTNHDAAPAAKALTDSASCGRGCDGTDKPVTLPAVGTGDIPVSRTRGRVGTILSEAEIDALEYVVEEGRSSAASRGSVSAGASAKINLSEKQIYWLAYAAEKLHNPHSKSCGLSQCSMAIIDILRSIGRWSDAGFVKRKAAK